jgi:hypothetical protein
MESITIGVLTTCMDIRTMGEPLASIFSVDLGGKPDTVPDGVLTPARVQKWNSLERIGLGPLFDDIAWSEPVTNWWGYLFFRHFRLYFWRIEVSARRTQWQHAVEFIEACWPELRFRQREDRPIRREATCGAIKVSVENVMGQMELGTSSSAC